MNEVNDSAHRPMRGVVIQPDAGTQPTEVAALSRPVLDAITDLLDSRISEARDIFRETDDKTNGTSFKLSYFAGRLEALARFKIDVRFLVADMDKQRELLDATNATGRPG